MSAVAPSASVSVSQRTGFGLRHVRALAVHGWLVGIVIAVALMAVAPPTAAIGAAGWAAGGAVQLASLAGWLAFRRAGSRAGPRAIAAVTWALPLDLAIMQWLAGGATAPYDELLLLALILGSVALTGVHFAAFCVAVAAAMLVPFVYGPDARGLPAACTALTVWLFVAVSLARLMQRIRGQGRLARLDQLTGLANRRAFDEDQPPELAGTALLIGDVDRFKRVNDRFGHLAGDECLQAVGQALREAVRPGDRLYRWGGDEFAILLDPLHIEPGDGLVARLEAAVAARVTDPEGDPVGITFGCAVGRAGADVRDLVDAADLALMERKRTRRAAVAVPTARH